MASARVAKGDEAMGFRDETEQILLSPAFVTEPDRVAPPDGRASRTERTSPSLSLGEASGRATATALVRPSRSENPLTATRPHRRIAILRLHSESRPRNPARGVLTVLRYSSSDLSPVRFSHLVIHAGTFIVFRSDRDYVAGEGQSSRTLEDRLTSPVLSKEHIHDRVISEGPRDLHW